MIDIIKNKRVYGQHFTPLKIFYEFILPEIKDQIYNYIWVDLFAGEGNLILPILDLIPENRRVEFFKNHIFLFDIQKEMVQKCISNAMRYGIPLEVAKKNINQRDSIKNYPYFLLDLKLPVYHITNPPYLYLGYIVKNRNDQKYLNYLSYFEGKNSGYQDLYQLCLINDLRNNIEKMIYIIPTNFLFGNSGSNKIRNDFFYEYNIKKAIIFEKQIFEFTGINVMICFFERKKFPKKEVINFEGIKINKNIQKKSYILSPKNNYRAGSYFDDFVNSYKSIKPINIQYYLTLNDVIKNKGNLKIKALDVCTFKNGKYELIEVFVNEYLFKRIKSNRLFIRTIDTGNMEGRVGLYEIEKVFSVDALLVTKEKYRTHPIQIFLEPTLSQEEQILLKEYFNLVLEYFREITDSEFMTTYKYSNSEYVRKYLGLSQAKKIIQTFPILTLNQIEKNYFKNLILSKNIEELMEFIKNINIGKYQIKIKKLWL
jgi:type I restriction-modification system DNA methylase subunit